jgi:pimeloyl-ACP methyl ester carboxylesterase
MARRHGPAQLADRTADRDGLRLAYVTGGEGQPPLVFVHGGLSSHHAFDPQLEHFVRTNRVLAADLRGHGWSAASETPSSIDVMADDIAFLCDSEGIVQALVVGHSMGGLVALDLARRYPQLTRALVLIESPIVPPEAHAARSEGLLAALRGREYDAFVVEWARRMVVPGASHAQRIVEEMRRTPQEVAVSVVEQMLGYDTEAAVVVCPVPILVVGGAVDVARLHVLRPDAIVLPPVGASHYGHLDAPGGLNALIQSALRGEND